MSCTPSAGNSSSETCAEFRVKYVGAIEKLQFDMSKTLQEPLDLINYIDAAQVRSWRKMGGDTLQVALICFPSQSVINITSWIYAVIEKML